jgi:DNA invertase Pin-like site-specific DNA recombinase
MIVVKTLYTIYNKRRVTFLNYYGYNRVSTKEQHEDRGNNSIREFCKSHNLPLEKIYVDKMTGKNFDRARYIVLKEDVLRPGDALIIPEYDRLGRADETKQELEYFKQKNIRVIFLDIPTTQMDLSAIDDNMARMILNCINDMMISFYDCMARSELERKKKRQKEGYEALRKRGEWDKLGRPRKMSKEDFKMEYQKVINGEMKTTELMKSLELNKDTYFRYVREYKKDVLKDVGND